MWPHMSHVVHTHVHVYMCTYICTLANIMKGGVVRWSKKIKKYNIYHTYMICGHIYMYLIYIVIRVYMFFK